jgi:hypothetical protein
VVRATPFEVIVQVLAVAGVNSIAAKLVEAQRTSKCVIF